MTSFAGCRSGRRNESARVEPAGKTSDKRMPENLDGEVVSVLFHNPENNYVVARIDSPAEPGQVTIVGNLGWIVPGERVSLTGDWTDHPKFGRQFKASDCSQTMPATVNGIRRYLASGMIKGVGPELAKRMLDRFGKEVLDILEEEPQRLQEIEGIGPKKLEKIEQSWHEQRQVRSLILFLQSHEVPPTYAGRIFQRYGTEAIEKLRENPYDLAYDIRGIGFKTADRMALKLGFTPDSPQRIEALLIYLLFQLSEQGHLFYPKSELFAKAIKQAEELSEDLLEQSISRLLERKQIQVQDLPEQAIEQAVFLRHFYRFEGEIAQRLNGLASHPHGVSGQRLTKAIAEQERVFGLALSEEQRSAVYDACRFKVSIITGGPGTGKTTITRLIVAALRKLGLSVKLAAPTGRAAKRLSEATGHTASTIHRLLGFQPGGSFACNEEKKLKADALVLDEASMLDCQLLVHLLRALPLTCRLVFIGDVNQLPSVGPGNVLEDMLQSGVLPSTRLTRIYRQARESMVVMNAHRINRGEFPAASEKKPPQADFFWVEQSDVQRVQELVVQMVCERIPEIYGLDPIRDVQVLTPMHKGAVGTLELNGLLQARLNPSGPAVQSGNRCFRAGDRVLQLRNNYEKEVFNGDLGLIRRLDLEEGELLIDFDGESKRYEQNELDELSLAYCISVHKSQGSEYPAVLLPVVTQHYLLLKRNLIYTALTRARQLAVLIGDKKALGMGIKNRQHERRYTHLQYRLKDAFPESGPERQDTA